MSRLESNKIQKGTPTILPDEAGAALLELAISIPLLLGLIFGALEYSRSFKQLQISAALSREAASVAYRECGGDGETAVECLDLAQDNFQRYAESLAPGSEVIISMYQRPTITSSPALLHSSPAAPISHTSRFSAGGSEILGIPNDGLISDHRRLVIAEVWLPFQAIVPGIGGIFNSLTDEFYDVTIL